MTTQLTFDQPLWFWLVAPASLVIALVLVRGYLTGSRGRRWSQAAMRFVGCALAITALARPHLSWDDPRDLVLLLVDVSESGAPQDLRAARDALQQLAASADRSSRGVGLAIFGKKPVVLLAPREGAVPGEEELALLEALATLPASSGADPGAARDGEPEILTRARALRDVAEPDGSNIEAALRLARGLMPSSTRRRVIVATDARETAGSAVVAASRAAQEGIVVDVLAPLPREDPEVLVSELVAPSLVHVREPFDLEIHVSARQAGRVELQVARNGFVLPARPPVDLVAGRNVVKIPSLSLDEGFHAFTARVLPAPGTDTAPENNVGRVAVAVSGRPRVLLVDDDPEGARPLVQALRGEEILAEVRPAAGLPAELDGLLAFDLVLLCDVEAASLPSGSMQLLKSYVRDYGGGLGMLGGEHSFGLGGYARTPIEDVLPVTMTVKKSIDDPNLALVSVIDASGSMSGAKIELAKEAAIAAAEVVQEFDRVGVVAFDSMPYLILPLTAASERGAIIDAVARLAAGGGTDIEPALSMAYDVLKGDRDGARIKHVILLSDGQAPGDPERLAQRMRTDGITVSAVAVGGGADRRLLEGIARAGGGRYHFTDDFANIPQIFTQETLTASKSLLVEEPTVPTLRHPDPVLDGIDLDTMPMLLGYVATTPRPEATVVLVSDLSDPILALGRAGSGWGMAFTSDAEYHWAHEWLEDWDSFPKLMSQVVRRVMRAGRDGSLAAEGVARRDEGDLVLQLDLTDRDGRFLSGLAVSATLSRDDRPNDAAQQVPLELASPGRYRATTPVPAYGVTNRIELIARNGDEIVLRRPLSFVESYSPEHRALDADAENLAAIATAGGGTTVTPASDHWSYKAPPGQRRSDLAGSLLAAGACLLLIEVAMRRLA